MDKELLSSAQLVKCYLYGVGSCVGVVVFVVGILARIVCKYATGKISQLNELGDRVDEIETTQKVIQAVCAERNRSGRCK